VAGAAHPFPGTLQKGFNSHPLLPRPLPAAYHRHRHQQQPQQQSVLQDRGGLSLSPNSPGPAGGPWGPVRAVTADTRGTQEEASIVQLQQLSAHRREPGGSAGAEGGGEGQGQFGRERGPLVVVPEALRSVVERQRQRIAELTAEVGELRQVGEGGGFLCHTPVGSDLNEASLPDSDFMSSNLYNTVQYCTYCTVQSL